MLISSSPDSVYNVPGLRTLLLATIAATASSPVRLAWPFLESSWLRAGVQSQAHVGDDRYAQDWLLVGGDAQGRAVVAPLSGVVVQSDWTCSPYGKTVTIWDKTRRLAVRFAHLDRLLVENGEAIVVGQQVGTVGRSGPAPWCAAAGFKGPSLPHLHIAVYRNVLDPNGRPIQEPVFEGLSWFASPFRVSAPQ